MRIEPEAIDHPLRERDAGHNLFLPATQQAAQAVGFFPYHGVRTSWHNRGGGYAEGV